MCIRIVWKEIVQWVVRSPLSITVTEQSWRMFSSFSLVSIPPFPLQHCMFPDQFLFVPSELALQVAVFRNFRAHRPQDAEAPLLDLILWRKANSIKQPQDDVLFYEGNPPTKQYLQHRRCLISCLFCKDQVELMRLSEVSNRFFLRS